MTTEYCPKCGSSQNMNVTITPITKTFAENVVDDVKENDSITTENGEILKLRKDEKPLPIFCKSYSCSKCGTFVKSENIFNHSSE